MFRFAKYAFLLIALGGMIWFSLGVKLGARTLVEHIQAIGGSDASQDLVSGTKQKFGEVKEGVQDVLRGGSALAGGSTTDDRADKTATNGKSDDGKSDDKKAAASPAKPQAVAEDHSEEDRQGLRRLIGQAAK